MAEEKTIDGEKKEKIEEESRSSGAATSKVKKFESKDEN